MSSVNHRTLLYGVFAKADQAEDAADTIVREIEPEDEMLPQTEVHEGHIKNKDLPISLEETVRGVAFGAALGSLGTGGIAFAIYMLAPRLSLAFPAQSPLEALLLIGAGGLFGALAGGLSYSTRNAARIRGLQHHIDRGRIVLTVLTGENEGERVRGTMNELGATEVGAVA